MLQPQRTMYSMENKAQHIPFVSIMYTFVKFRKNLLQTCVDMKIQIVFTALEFSLNEAELSLNSVKSGNSENLRNHWSMNWVQYKDLICYLCLCGLVVSPLSLTQEILGSSPTLLIFI